MFILYQMFKKTLYSMAIASLFLGACQYAQAQNSSEYVSLINGWKADGSNLTGGLSDQYGFVFYSTYTNYGAIKVYVPAGTTGFSILGYLPQQTIYAVAARFGQPPTRVAPLGGGVGVGEYAQIISIFREDTAFAKLLAGEEMIQVHDGGGATGYAGVARLTGRPMLKGQWLYMRVLNDQSGGGIYNLSGFGTVDLPMYKEAMASVQIQPNGNPREDFVLPQRPTGIVLQPTAVAPGGNGAIGADNPNALALGRCAADSTNELAKYITIQNYKITVAATAPLGVVKISCGDATDYSSSAAYATPVFHANLTVGNPQPLEAITLSSDKLIATSNPTPITINAYPVGAALGVCAASDASLVTVSGNAIILTDAGKSVSNATNLTVTCSGKTMPFSIQPGLTLSPSTLTMNSTPSKTVVSASGVVGALNCTLPVGTGAFNPSAYLDWLPAESAFALKSSAPAMTAEQETITVTCSDSSSQRSAVLTLKAAPPGLLYPLHNDELPLAIGAVAPPARVPGELHLRWRKVNTNGTLESLPLAGNYPGYPVAGDGAAFKCEDSKGLFDFSSVAETFKGSLKAVASSSSAVALTTKVSCYAWGSNPLGIVAGSLKSTASLLVQPSSVSWELAQPTAANPILDVTDDVTAATPAPPVKLQLYIPKAADNSDVKVVLMGYVPLTPSFLWDDNVRAEVFLTNSASPVWKTWEDQQNATDVVYTTVSNSSASRVLDVSLLFPKSDLKNLRAKLAMFYTTTAAATNSGTWVKLNAEWDSTAP